MEFHIKLKNYREDKDLTQKQIADLIPMNQSNYSKIESGIQEPSLHQLIRISEILEVTIDDLLDINNDELIDKKIQKIKNELEPLINKNFKN